MRGKYFILSVLIVGISLAIAFGNSTFRLNPGPAQATPAPAPEKIVWRAQSSWGAGVPVLQESAVFFAKKVGELTNGRLVVKMNPGGSIVPAFTELEGVHKGTIDLACTASTIWLGKIVSAPLFGSVPGGFEQQEYLGWLYAGGGMELWQEMYDGKGFNVRVCHPHAVISAENFSWSHKPIRSLKDFKGLKFRTIGFWGEALAKLGASVVTLPGGEVYPALERKVLDAAEFSIPAVDKVLGFQEICHYLTVPGVHQPSLVLETIVNKKSWEKLPDDLKPLVDAAADAAMVWCLAHGKKKNADAMKFFREYGVEIIELSPEVQRQIKKACEEVIDEHAKKDSFFAKVLDSQKKFHAVWRPYEKLITFEYD